ncbi:dephospho-CoA kinase [Rhizobium oryzicola]|uniref:Dephospho-CoA kinase n=1 Tax=Rhizobium oryzicola TaxID=1232668 RepID=A0ABT8T241_9HYPH|nr:dephospho-CoA kinase [Rhizobium oryzicola]MDO1584727.1 dephospho-CoA kinase [Rhizobium oryzicola]
MIKLGLTGSIGMGKSTTAKLFADAGIPVNDADAVVHDLYRGEAVPLVERAFPGSTSGGEIDRTVLARQLAERPERFKELEAIVHPLVREKERQFVERMTAAGSDMVLLDIPLLFETRAEQRVDVVIVVSCYPQLQRQRVLARPGMTEDKFNMILARQTPDAEKRARADFVIETDHGLDAARIRVSDIIGMIRNGKRSERINA